MKCGVVAVINDPSCLIFKEKWEAAVSDNDLICERLEVIDADNLPGFKSIIESYEVVLIIGLCQFKEATRIQLEKLTVLLANIPLSGAKRPKIIGMGTGSIVVAKALGGKTEKRNQAPSFKRITYSESLNLFPWSYYSMESEVAFEYTHESITGLPPNSICLAKSGQSIDMFYTYFSNSGCAVCLNCHPELDLDSVLDVLPIFKLEAREEVAFLDCLPVDLDSRRLLAMMVFVAAEESNRYDGNVDVDRLRLSFAESMATFVSPPSTHHAVENLPHLADEMARSNARSFLRGDCTLENLPNEIDARSSYTPAVLQVRRATLIDSSKSTDVPNSHSMNILACACLGKETIVSGGADKKICWIKNGTCENTLTLDAPVTVLRPFKSDKVFFGTLSGAVGLIDQSTMCSIGTTSHSKMLTGMTVSPCNRWLATCARDRMVRVYNVEADEAVTLYDLHCANTPEAIDFVRVFGSICLVVSVRDERDLQYLVVETVETDTTVSPGDVIRTNMNENGDDFVSFSVLALACAAALPLVAAATDKSRIIIWEAGTETQYRNLYGHSCSEYGRPALAWHPTLKYLASNSELDMAIYIWDIQSSVVVLKLTGHLASVRDLVFRDTELVSCSFDRRLKLWGQVNEIDNFQ